MGSLWELWSEISAEAESLADPVLLECLQAGQSQRIFDDLSDDNLKSVLSVVNGLLNNPKTREKGNMIFNQLVLSVAVTRFVGFQDTVASTLHLVCKNLSSHNAQNALSNFLPNVKKLPDVNQAVVALIVPKIMTFCIEELTSYEERQPTVEAVKLLQTCLTTFRGPCGPFRDRLEKSLIPLLDHENSELFELICDLFPLMSGTGGSGGNSEKDKHSADWSNMVNRLLKEAYDTLYQLCCDACPTLEEDNPFEKGLPPISLPGILHPKVFLRNALLKRRLVNIISVVCSYLRSSFPAAKSVGVGHLLKMINYLIAVNPVSLQSSSRKEFTFLTALLPRIHVSAFNLLSSLISCVGSNLLPESVKVENFFSQQWKWLDSKKNSFENAKLAMYGSLLKWLKLTCGEITNPKTYQEWVDLLLKDVRLDKEQIELKLLPKSKKEKKQAKTQALSFLVHSQSSGFIFKSPNICKASLMLLQNLICGSRKSSSSYKAIFHVVADVNLEVYQSTSFPSPYDQGECRLELQKCILELAINPYTQDGYGVPIGLIEALLQKGATDPFSKVSVYCQHQLSILERLVHPMCASLEFLAVDLTSRREPMAINEETTINDDKQTDNIITADVAIQTETLEVENTSIVSDEEDDFVKKTDFNEITNEFRQLKSLIISLQNTNQQRSIEHNPQPLLFSPRSTNGSSHQLLTSNPSNGLSIYDKNKVQNDTSLIEEDDDVQFIAAPIASDKVVTLSKEAATTVQSKSDETLDASLGNGVSAEVYDMMVDFIDEPPTL